MRIHTAAHLLSEAVRKAVGRPLEIIGSAINIEKARLDFRYERSIREFFPKIEEIANMVMGGVKSRLLENISNLEISIPSVISGKKLKNSLGEGAEKISVKVNIEDEYVAELLLLYRESGIE